MDKEKIRKLKEKILKYVGFDTPEFRADNSYRTLDVMLDELIKFAQG